MTDSAPSTAKRLEGESESDWQARVKRIRRETVLETLESLGFDVEDTNEMQKDAIFLRRFRKASESTSAKVWGAIITLFFGLIGAVATLFIQSLGPK